MKTLQQLTKALALFLIIVFTNINAQSTDSSKVKNAARETKDKQEKYYLSLGKALQLSGYTQFRYQAFQENSKIDGADLRRVRLDLKGVITPDWDYRLQVDFAGTPKILDGYINYTLDDYLKITAGQLKIPFSSENQISDDKSESIERSQVVEALVARSTDVIGNQNGRDIGLQFSGSLFKNNGQYFLDYYAGVFNGQGINASDKNKQKDFSGRVVLHPIRGLDLGGSYYNGFDNFGSPAGNYARTRYGAELKLAIDYLSISSEYIYGSDNNVNRDGWYALIGYYVIPKKLQPILKLDSYNPNKDQSGLVTTAYTIGANYFFNDWTKLQVNYTIKREETIQIDNDVFAAQLQIGF